MDVTLVKKDTDPNLSALSENYWYLCFNIVLCVALHLYLSVLHQQPHYTFAHRTFRDGAGCEIIVLCMSKSVVFCLGYGLGLGH